MKRRITFLLALALLFTLAACGGAPEKNVNTSMDSDRSFANSNSICATEDTIYFLRTSTIHYVDKETGISGPLCGKPECDHALYSDTCNAYSGGDMLSCLSVYNGRLYWLTTSPFALMSCALDGTDHQTVRDLREDPLPHYNQKKAVFHRGYMYLYLMEDSIEDGEVTYVMHLFAVPLAPDEEVFEIFYERPTVESVYFPIFEMQAYSDALYFSIHTYAGVSEGDVPFYEYKFLRFDITNRETEILYRDDDYLISSTLNFWVADDGIIFSDYTEEDGFQISKIDFGSGQISSIIPGAVGHIAANLLVTDMDFQRGQISEENGIDCDIEFGMRIMDFEGSVLVEDTYSFTGPFSIPGFCGSDENYAYYYDTSGCNSYDEQGRQTGYTDYLSIFAIALDGSGARLLCTEEDYIKYN